MASKPVLPEFANLPNFRVQKRRGCVSHPPMREGRSCFLPILSQVMESFKKTRGFDLCPRNLSCGGPDVRPSQKNAEEYSLTRAALTQQQKEETRPPPQPSMAGQGQGSHPWALWTWRCELEPGNSRRTSSCPKGY